MTILERIGMWLARRVIEANEEIADQYRAKMESQHSHMMYLQRQDAASLRLREWDQNRIKQLQSEVTNWESRLQIEQQAASNRAAELRSRVHYLERQDHEMRRELEGKRLDFIRMNDQIRKKTQQNASLQTQLRDVHARTRGAVALAIETLELVKAQPCQHGRIDHAIAVLQNVVPHASEPSSDVQADPPQPQRPMFLPRDPHRVALADLMETLKQRESALTSSPGDAESIAPSPQAHAPQPSTQPPPTVEGRPIDGYLDSVDKPIQITPDRVRTFLSDTPPLRCHQTCDVVEAVPDTATTHRAPQPPPPSTPS